MLFVIIMTNIVVKNRFRKAKFLKILLTTENEILRLNTSGRLLPEICYLETIFVWQNSINKNTDDVKAVVPLLKILATFVLVMSTEILTLISSKLTSHILHCSRQDWCLCKNKEKGEFRCNSNYNFSYFVLQSGP